MADQNFRVKRGLEVGIGATVLSATSGGNVGVGTTNPTTTLDVNGGVRIRGALYDKDNQAGNANQVLISTGSGIDWVNAAPSNAITGLTVRDEGTIVGGANSVSELNFVGNIVSVASTLGIATITFLDYVSNAGVATYATTAGIATYATTAGIATYATSAGIATYATSSGIATYATSAGIATYATSAGIATYATSAGIATYATSAGIATYATSSGIATYATTAGIATYATTAGIATYATSSGIATYATSSGIATYATLSGIATYATTAGVATALQNARTFEITGDIIASPISFNGTGNVSLAATIQPNSVSLGTDTTGDYVQTVSGTSNQITVTGGTGEGSTPTLSIPSQFTAPQDVTVTRDLQVNRNLNVTGNITIGGTSATLFTSELKVSDPDLVLGFRTDAFGNDASTDTTANHGGIAIASTEGSPLVQLFIAGIETTPATYKKIMWFKAGTFAGLGTDAWLSNYAVGIGSTQFPSGTRLAAGNVQFTQNDLAVVRNINASGIVTALSFSGNASSATYATSAGISTYATTAGISTYATTAGVSTSVIGGIGSITQLNVSGITTVGFITATNLYVAGVGTFLSQGLKIRNTANTFEYTIIGDSIAANRTLNLPLITGTDTLVVRTLSQTFNNTQTFAGTLSCTGTIDLSGSSTGSHGFATNQTTAFVAIGGPSGTGPITFGYSTASQTTNIQAGASGVGTTKTINFGTGGLSGSFTQINIGPTAGVGTVTINSGTNLGINSTTPTSALDVVGNVKVIGVVTATSFSGNASSATYATTSGIATYATTAGIATYATSSGIATYAITAGVSTSVIGGIGSITQLQVTGISTFANGPVFIGAATSTGAVNQKLQVVGGASFTGTGSSVGIGTTNPLDALTVFGRVQIQQDSGSSNRLVFRGQPSSLYRWNIDNFGSNNDFRIFREDDATSANGSVAVSISTTGTVTATKFSGDGSLLTGITASGAGIVVQNQGSTVGTAGTLNFSTNLTASFASGTATISLSNNPSISGILTADQVYTSNNGNGTNVRIGDDLWIGDVNIANTTRFSGAQDSTKAFVIFGSSDSVALGRTGTGPLYYGGNLTVAGVVTASSFSGNASSATYATSAGLSTHLKGGSGGTIVYQSATDTTAFLANGASGFILQSNGGTNAPSWVAAAPAGAITGLTIRDEGTIVGTANSVSELNFVGNIVSVNSTSGIATITFGDYIANAGVATYATTAGIATYSTTAGVSTSVIGGIGSITQLQVTGVSTFTNGPVLVGSSSTTGTASQRLQVTGGAYISGNTGIGTTNPQSALDVRGAITVGVGTVGINSVFSTTDIQSWQYTYKSKAAGDTSPTAVYVGAAGTALYVVGDTANSIIQYTLSTAYDVSTAGASVGTFSVATQETNAAGIDFNPTGTKMFISGLTGVAPLIASGDYVHEYSLSTAWTVSTAGYTTSYNVTQDTSPQGVIFGNNGSKMYVCGATGDAVYQYSLSTPYSIASGVTYDNKSLILGTDPILLETSPTDISFNSTGTVLWVIGQANDRIYEFRLGTAWDISTAVFYDDVYIGFWEPSGTGLQVIPEQNVAYIVGSSNDTVYQFSTNTPAIEIASSGISSVSSIVLNNETRVKDRLYVKGRARFNEALVTQGNLQIDGASTLTGAVTASSTLSVTSTLTGNAAVTFDTTTSNLNFGTSQTTGTVIVGGTSQTGTITLGRATTTQITNIQAGASGVGTTKTINLGTGGLSGSFSQINIGPTAGVGTVTINSGTNLLIGTATTTGTASQPLQVTGGAYVSGNLGVGNTNAEGIKLFVSQGNPAANRSVALITDDGTIPTMTSGATLRISNDGSGSTFALLEAESNAGKLVFTNAGSLGIGTTNPTSKLSVVGDGNFTGVVTASSFSGNASSATYSTTAGIATYATTAGIATYATSSGIATYATTAGVSTSVIGGIGSITQLQVTGVSTFSNGPVLIGSATSTGTASQRLQVTGGAYVSGPVGVGTTNPQDTVDVGLGTIRLYNKSSPTRFSQIYQDGALTFKNSSVGDDFQFVASSNSLMVLKGSGPLILPGTASLTGTASQLLQVTGGAYVSTALGVGVTNPASNTQVAIAGTLGISEVGGAGTRTLFTSTSAGFVLNHSDNSNIDFRVLNGTKLQYQYSPNFWTIPAGIPFLVGTASSTGTANQLLRVEGGAYVSGNLGIGTTNPTNPLTVYGTNNDTVPILALLSGNNSTSFNSGAQIAFGYNGTPTYQHFIQTRHNSANSSNAIDFYVSDGTQNNTLTSGSVHTMSLVSGSVGINSTSPTSRLDVVGDAKVSGVVTATTFIGNLTGTATTASSVALDSVGLGTHTYGDYVKNLTGTANQITVTGGTGEGSTPTLSIPSQFTAPQDVTVTRDLQVNRNLNVNGNITIGGTSATLFTTEFKVYDPDIVLGFRTDAFGNDASTDTTANHGGIAIASTEGSPLVQLFIAGIETTPTTYKKIMWFKAGTFSGLGTDAWLSNYAIGIGSTQFPTGTRLAAGNVQFTQNDLAVVRDINASGVVTASSFSGNASSATYATTAGIATYATTAGVSTNATYATTSGIATYATTAGIATYATTAGIATYATTAGVSTNATYATTSGIATYATTAGIATYATTAGIATYATTAGVSTNATYATTAGIATYATTAGIATYATSSGIATYATTAGIATYATTAGIATYATTAGIATYATTAGIATYATSSGIATYATTAGVSTSVIGGIGSITQLQVTGVSTFSNGPVLIGSATSTGTASQRLQVTGGAYFSGTGGSANVGVGTTNPQYIFTVTDTGTPATVGLTNCLADFTTTANSYGQINLRNTSSGTNASGDIVITADNGNDSTNFIDLGINNSGFSVGSWTINGANDGYLYTSDGNLSIGAINASVPKYISFFTGGTLISNERMRINATGVGIGTTNPLQRFQVGAAGTTVVVVDSIGEVGIGTTNPTQSLHVQGNARITGAFYDSTNAPGTSGQVLQSTVTGTQWTTAAAGGGSGKFDTTIDNVLYIQPTGTLDVVGVGTTVTQITTLPGGSSKYIVHSIHVTNISNGDAEITSGFILNNRKVPASISVSVGSSGGAGIHTFTVGSASSITVGMAVTGTGNIGETTGIGSTAGFQFNTYVTSVDGNTITLSKPMSGRATGTLFFSPVSKVSSRLPVPVGSAVELLKQPMILNALDSIVLQSTGAGSGIGSTSTFQLHQTANVGFLTVTAGAAITNFIAAGMLVQGTGSNTGIQTNTFVGVGYTPGALTIPITRPATTSLASTSYSFTEVVVPQDGALQATIVYQSSTDTSYQNGTGTVVGIVTLASLATSPTVGITSTVPLCYYGTGNTYPSVVQSIRVSNISDGSIYPGGDYPVWVGIGNSDTVFSWLAYNMIIPKNSSIELCEAPKRIGIGQSIFAYSNTPGVIEIQVAAKQKTS